MDFSFSIRQPGTILTLPKAPRATSPRGAAVINTDQVGGGRASWYCEEKLLDELIAGLAFIVLKERGAAGKRAVGALCRIAAVVCR